MALVFKFIHVRSLWSANCINQYKVLYAYNWTSFSDRESGSEVIILWAQWSEMWVDVFFMWKFETFLNVTGFWSWTCNKLTLLPFSLSFYTNVRCRVDDRKLLKLCFIKLYLVIYVFDTSAMYISLLILNFSSYSEAIHMLILCFGLLCTDLIKQQWQSI